MERNEIAALAKGMVPFVHEVVAAAVAPLAARIAEVEARPIQKGDVGERGPEGPPGPGGPKGDNGELAMVPPELAEQVADAVRLLHESPPIIVEVQRMESKPPPRISRIERDDDGNLVPIYDGAQS